MSVVRGEARRRWFCVLSSVAVLCALPALVAAFPTSAPRLGAEQLRERILGSAAVPYQGYAESRGALGLPDLPGLGDVSALLGGSTRIRAWHTSPERWRVDVLEPTGERDLYRAGESTSVWDYERNLVTEIAGEPPVRLPRATDLLPPDLARRLLGGTSAGGGSGRDPVRAIGARRVAGVDASGLRMVPSDPATLVGQVEVWAEAVSGLPLEVRVTGREQPRTVLVTRFLDIDRGRPELATTHPVHPRAAGRTTTSVPDMAAWMSRFAPYPLPDRLAGRARVPVPADVAGVGGYGSGLSAFVVLPLPGRLGPRAFSSARVAGATPVALGAGGAGAGGEGMLVRTPLLTALLVRPGPRSDHRSGSGNRTFLLAGTVTPDVLENAAAELLVDIAPAGNRERRTRSLRSGRRSEQSSTSERRTRSLRSGRRSEQSETEESP